MELNYFEVRLTEVKFNTKLLNINYYYYYWSQDYFELSMLILFDLDRFSQGDLDRYKFELSKISYYEWRFEL